MRDPSTRVTGTGYDHGRNRWVRAPCGAYGGTNDTLDV